MSTPNAKPWQSLGISQATYYRHRKAGTPPAKRLAKQTLSDWIQWREAGIEIRPWRDHTKALQVHYAQHYLASGSPLTPDAVRAYLTSVPREQLSKRKHIHASLSSIAKYLCSIEKLSREDYLKIRGLYPKAPPNYRPQQNIIQREDLPKILATIQKAHQRYNRELNYALSLLLSESGLRVSEACRLKWKDLSFSSNPNNAFIYIKDGKGGKSRTVPFSKAAQEALTNWREIAVQHEGTVFIGFNPKTGYSPLDRSCVARRLKNISKQCGIVFTAHSFRHYRITQWANNPRIPIAVTQKWAGHNSLEITQKYIHISDAEALEAAYE